MLIAYRHPSTSYDAMFLERKAIMEQTWQPMTTSAVPRML